MIALVDTSIMIDVLRGVDEALACLEPYDALHASEISRLEVLAGMRPTEEAGTRALLSAFVWHDVDQVVAEMAGQLGRAWLRGNQGIDSADLAVAATALRLGAPLLTLNTKHFPMFPGLAAPYAC